MKEQTEWEKKLSQLLWEYMEEKKKNPEWFLEISTVLMCSGDSKAMDSYMVSKQFWFIKWLVDNDKIDLSNEEYFYQDTIYELEQAQLIKDLSDYLIMKLSISDNPAELLISVLKQRCQKYEYKK